MGHFGRSAFECIAAADGAALRAGEVALPDEQDGVPWAGGAQDGTLIYHWGGSAKPEDVDLVYAALEDAIGGGPDAVDRVRAAVRDVRIVTLVEALLNRVGSSEMPPDLVYDLARRLALESAEREAVKLGMILLGLFDAAEHRDELMLLGRHDEFTLYAAVALSNREGGAEEDLWALARQVTGWGRIHLVERLAESKSPDLRDWILTEGFRNRVSNAYLAGIAATCGDLAGRLAERAGDRLPEGDPLLPAAGDLLTALCDEDGPVPNGLEAYSGGEPAIELYLGYDGTDLRYFLTVAVIRDYIRNRREELAGRCDEILGRPDWLEMARAGLAAADAEEFWRAEAACRLLELPTLDAHLLRLSDDPCNGVHWSSAMAQADDESIERIVTLAIERLPLQKIATGPADEDGSGPDREPHRCLDAFLPALGEWPGKGWPIVAAALESPVIRNRMLAVRTLAAWDRAAWPTLAHGTLYSAVRREPDATVKEAIRRLQEGRPPDD